MTRPRRIAAVSTSRADFGLIAPILTALKSDERFDLHLIAARPAGAEAFSDVEALNFPVDYRIELNLSDDSAVEAAAALATCVSAFAEALEAIKPTMALLPGDRFEMLGAASAALLARIPVAHLYGGDVTEGAIDDAARHALTKLSHLHFCTNEAARRRIMQMGEDPARVFNFGSPALDAVRDFEPMSREAFFDAVGLRPGSPALLVTHHPATLGDQTPEAEIHEVLRALETFGPDATLLFTGVNIDPGHRAIADAINAFCAARANARCVETLGRSLYFNALTHMDVVVGNSSSGLYEAPSFKTSTVNIGPRQDGRLRAESVIDCAAQADMIAAAIDQALALDCTTVTNPYGDGRGVARIVEALAAAPPGSALTRKTFHALD